MSKFVRISTWARLLLAVFLVSTLFTTFAGVLNPQPAHALENDNGSAGWSGAYTIHYVDSNSHRLSLTYQNPDKTIGYDIFEEEIQKSTDYDYFVGDTIKDYKNNVGFNYSKGDTEICTPVGWDDGIPTALIRVQKNTDPLKAQIRVVKFASLHWCMPTDWTDVQISPRPEIPNPVPLDQGSVSWLNPNNIVIYHAGPNSPNLSQAGIVDGQEFDVSAVNNDQMVLTATSESKIPECKGFSSQIIIDPYKTYKYAHLYTPNIPEGKFSCTEVAREWLNVTNTYSTPTPDKYSTASWVSGNSIQFNAGYVGGTADNPGTPEFQDQNLNTGDVFTQSSLSGNDMTLVAPEAATGCTSKSTMEVDPYLGSQFVYLRVIGINDTTRRCGQVATTWLELTNSNPQTDISFDSTADQIALANQQCPLNGVSLDWLLCPIYNLGKGAVQVLNGQIQNMLYINPDQIFGTPDQPSAFAQAYNTFRNFGLALLVIAGLVMVVSQSAGLEIFSAYTIRKALPRIVIAAIGMALAWPILQFAIVFFNDLGSWVSGLILSAAPASAGGSNYSNIGSFIIQSVFVAGTAGVTIVVLGALGALSFLATFLVALLVGYITLVLRQIVILVAILLAPLAIAMSVLPGTEKFWKLWRDSLVSALLMFPIVMGFLSAGAALAAIAGTAARNADAASGATGGGSGTALSILAMLAYFIPYLMIPAAFRAAGGIAGNLYGVVGERAKGIQAGLGKYRQGQRAENWQKLKAGSRYNEENRMTRLLGGSAVNYLGRHAGAGLRGRFGLGLTEAQRMRGQAAMANNMVLSADEASKLDNGFRVNRSNPLAMAAVISGNNEAVMRRLFPNLNNDQIRDGLAIGRTIRSDQQMQTAALDAISQGGADQIVNSGQYHSIAQQVAHGNNEVFGSINSRDRATLGGAGRRDLRRADAAGAMDVPRTFREMTIEELKKQRPSALPNLFNAAGIGAALTARGVTAAEKEHIAFLTYAATQNNSVTPQQRQALEGAMAIVRANGLDARAQQLYRESVNPV